MTIIPSPVLLQANIEALAPLQQYGLPGLFILSLICYIYFKDKTHKEERKEWKDDTKALNEKHEIAMKGIVDDFKVTMHDIYKLMVRVETKLEDRR
jgi:hypothetical protein